MSAKQFDVFQWFHDAYDEASFDEYIYQLSYIIGLTDEIGGSDKDSLMVFLSDLRKFKAIVESQTPKASDHAPF